jgi:hypothetical protein
MEVIGPMADALMEREMLTKARAVKLIKRAIQTAAMVQIALNGMSLLEETQDEENAAAVAAASFRSDGEGLQNPFGVGVPAVPVMPDQSQNASALQAAGPGSGGGGRIC